MKEKTVDYCLSLEFKECLLKENEKMRRNDTYFLEEDCKRVSSFEVGERG
jgi:hypothetical protein